MGFLDFLSSPAMQQAAQQFGATLQDVGANWSGREGNNLDALKKKLEDQKAYQAQLDALGSGQGGMPGGDKIAQFLPLLKNLPPEKGMQFLMQMTQQQATPKPPLIARAGDIGLDPNNPSGAPLFSIPEQANFGGAPQQGVNPTTGKPGLFVKDERTGNVRWLDAGVAPKINFVNGQAVDENAVAPGTVIPPQEQGPVSPAKLQQLLDIAKARGTQAGNVQSVQQAADGSLIVVHRDGKIEHMNLDGSSVKGTQAPGAVFDRAAAGSAGKAAGTAAEALPTTTANFDIINKTLSDFELPAVKSQAGAAIGFGGFLPTVPGINSDFKSRVDQLQGETFLQAFSALKGAGAITEVEGSKATAAIARLNKAQTPAEFYTALNDAKTTFRTLFDAAKTRATRGATVPQLQGGAGQASTPGVIRYDAQGKRIQ